MDTLTQPMADTQAPSSDATSTTVDFESMAIPETYKESAVGKYKTTGELIKGYENAQKLIGAKGVIIPSDNATPEEWDKYYRAIGRPDKADGYKLSPVDGLHPELKMTPEAEKGFKDLMHKHGIPQRQADALRKDYYQMLSQSLTKRDEGTIQAKQKAEAELRQAWGADYDTNINKIKTVIDKFGGNGAREAFGDLGNNPMVLKTFANIAKNFSEDTFVKGDNIVPSDVAQAQAQLKNIMDDRTHPYWVSGKGHDEAVQEVRRLQEIITPNERKLPE